MVAIADEIYLGPSSDVDTTKTLLVFYITGNPGLIEYYRLFLTRLHQGLQTRCPELVLHVYGASLTGFEVGNDDHVPIANPKQPPYSLEEQIESTMARLLSTANSMNGSDSSLPVVIVGHSVGTYMLLEIISRWQAMRKAGNSRLNIVGGICLFPTVVDIAKSPSGRIATVGFCRAFRTGCVCS